MKEGVDKYIIIGAIAVLSAFAIDKWLKSFTKPINSGYYDGLDLNEVLSKGSTGDEVYELQRILVNQYKSDLGYSGLNKDGIDGEFGGITEKALLEARKVKQISLKQILTNK